jgi:uncharacterized protein YbjT (DUF2867 family)
MLIRTFSFALANAHHSTGATGYIGGSVLEAIIKKYTGLHITALLRSPSSEFKSRYPQVNIAIGDFDAFDVIEMASSEADIVIREWIVSAG